MKVWYAIGSLLCAMALLTSCGATSLASVGASARATKTPATAYTSYPPVHVGVIVDFATSNVCHEPLLL